MTRHCRITNIDEKYILEKTHKTAYELQYIKQYLKIAHT